MRFRLPQHDEFKGEFGLFYTGGGWANTANLVQNRGGSTGFAATDLPNGANPQLIPLGFNGGASATVALQAGSAAINAVPAASCSGITVDQRGYRRPAGNCDIGAYDSEAVAVLFADGFD